MLKYLIDASVASYVIKRRPIDVIGIFNHADLPSWAPRPRVFLRQAEIAVSLMPRALQTFWIVSKRGWASGRRAL